MAQLNWTYYSLRGLPYLIEMYHGDKSGHLMVFVNSNIVHIDFNKTDTSEYSFFIEDQLLKLEIKEENQGHNYVLTPQPMQSGVKNDEKIFDEHFWIPLIILIIAFNLIFILVN